MYNAVNALSAVMAVVFWLDTHICATIAETKVQLLSHETVAICIRLFGAVYTWKAAALTDAKSEICHCRLQYIKGVRIICGYKWQQK